MRAGIVVTGTEVLTGRVADRNGPWLAERLEDAGVELAHVAIVGDRREDLHAALRFMTTQGMDVVITSGGLGPTADDLTTEVVADAQGREMVWDAALQARIEAIVAPFQRRWRNVDPEAMRAGARKQATVPVGATVLEPVGTAPGLVVPPARTDAPTQHQPDQAQLPGRPRPGPTVIVLPGPPRELQPMWEAALRTGAFAEALAGAREYRRGTLRLFGIPESEIAQTLREAEREGIALERLEVTTCLKRGEVEVVTRYEPDAEGAYEQLVALVRRRHADTLFSTDGTTIDEQVAALLRGAPVAHTPDPAPGRDGAPATRAGTVTIAVAESCTGGLLAARLTDVPGASAYVRGAIVAYANNMKSALAGVPAELIERHGAVSPEVAEALAEGARARLEADVGVGITGIAGPGGGTPEKPVGMVCLSVAGPGAGLLTRTVTIPGSRDAVRERATTVALHLVRRALTA